LIPDVPASVAVAHPHDRAEMVGGSDRLGGELVRPLLDPQRRHLPHQGSGVDHLETGGVRPRHPGECLGSVDIRQCDDPLERSLRRSSRHQRLREPERHA
jgi:hypothetical protein